MRQKSLLLLASLMLTLACLGAPQPAQVAVNEQTATSKAAASESAPSATSQPTALPSYLARLKVTYIRDGNIWYWDASAGARQLTSDGDAWEVKISDDGKAIVYQRNRSIQGGPVPAEELGDSLWAVDTDGTPPRELVNVTSYALSVLPPIVDGLTLNLAQFEIQPGTHWVYFNTEWARDVSYSIAANDLHRVDADAPKPQTLLISDGGRFRFSPDGNWLTLSSITSIKVIHTDGTGLVSALSFPIASNQIDYKPQTVWMNDASGFYTVIPSTGTFRFMYVAANGSFSAQLAEFSPVRLDLSSPLLSPDGLKVAYWKMNGITAELHVVEASTTDTIIASYENPPMFEHYGWSPDSKRIVFFISDPLFPFAAGIGIPPAPLTASASPYSLRWIDSERFLFFREGRLLVGQLGTPEVFEVASGFQKQFEFVNRYDFVLLPSP